jgi:hypothetical protein
LRTSATTCRCASAHSSSSTPASASPPKNWDLAVECLNLLDREDNDIEYFYDSRLPGESLAGFGDRHFHPTAPRSFRVSVTYRF